MEKKESIIPDLKKQCCFFDMEEGQVVQRKNLEEDYNYLLFFLEGSVEIIYGSMRPQVIREGSMVMVSRLSNFVCTAKTPVKMAWLGFDDIMNSCDRSILHELEPIFSLLKYEFRELEIKPSLHLYLDLLKEYITKVAIDPSLYAGKQRELFILFRAYYSKEEMVMLFYPLLGKNMEFKRQVIDGFSRVKNASELASLCGYSQVVFQRKFKDIFNETVYQWMQRQKAEQIEYLMMAENINLKTLADQLEFTSPAHLNQFCKVWFGMTPSELRQTLLLKKKLR